LAILPFEPPYFEKYGLKTIFIGHPITENAPNLANKLTINFAFRAEKKISREDILLYVTPGSRNGEVTKIFPEFIEAINLLAKEKPNLKVLIPLADKTRKLVSEMSSKLEVEYFLIEKEQKEEALFASDFALAKSGTNSLEASLYKIPLIIAYKINVLTHFIVSRMIKIKFANLINLILNRELIKEMLQDDCQGQKIFFELRNLIENKEMAKNQVEESQAALKIMGLEFEQTPSQKAAVEILKL
jgi:lipid-A-disaccharide synthase